MTRSSLCLLSLVIPLGLAFSTLRADTITLNSGEKVEGKILSETDTDLTVEVRISSTIKDERAISKSEIANVEKTSEDTEAFSIIKNLRINEDHSYPAEAYDQMLITLGNFIQQYPLSEHLADVKAQLAGLQEEQTRVKNGDLKYRGQWLNAAEAAKEKFEIEANQTLDLLKTYGNRSDYSNALNTFDLIATKYRGSRALPDAIDYTKQFLPGLLADAQRRAAALKIEQETFMRNIKFRQEPQRSQYIAAAQREQANYTALMNNSKGPWKPYIGRSNSSLTFYIQQIPAAITSLAAIKTAPMRESVGLVAQARTALDAKNTAGADSALTEATTLWPENAEAKVVATDLAALKKDLAATPTPTPKPSATPKPTVVAITPAATPEPAASSSSFLFSIKGALMILAIVLVLAGASLFLGKRRPKDLDI